MASLVPSALHAKHVTLNVSCQYSNKDTHREKARASRTDFDDYIKYIQKEREKKEWIYKLECPVGNDKHSLVKICQNLISLSQEPLTMRFGFVGENVTLDTL